MASIKSALAQAAERLAAVSDSALLDAEILLCRVLDKERSHLRAWPDKCLQAEHASTFWTLVEERQQGKPIAYILSSREFWSREFYVTPDVLIPRPDTELLIELSLKLLPEDQPASLIDLGTGSGIIAITLAAERPQAKVSAADISLAALAIAKHNALRHQLSGIRFYHSNWFAQVPAGTFDLIISNPPYISENDSHLQQGDIRFEPQSALVATQQGLSDIKIIAGQARSRLKNQGHLLIEHGYNQQQQVQAIFTELGYDQVQTYQDLSGQPRVTYGQWHTEHR
jgi:release factor glutamine methyltransferase